MKTKRHDVSNAVISLFTHGEINFRSKRLAKSVCSEAQKMITLLKKSMAKAEAESSEVANKIDPNVYRVARRRFAPVNGAVITSTINNHVIKDAINNKDVAGGYVHSMKMQAPNTSDKFRNNPGFYRLKVLRRENVEK